MRQTKTADTHSKAGRQTYAWGAGQRSLECPYDARNKKIQTEKKITHRDRQRKNDSMSQCERQRE